MKWCISYRANQEIQQEVDEIRFSDLNHILDIREQSWFAEKRIILEILDINRTTLNGQPLTYDMLKTLLIGMDNLYLDFYTLQSLEEFFDTTNNEYNTRCMYHNPVDNYNLLNFLLNYNVSDITLMEPLAFDMKNVSHYIRYDNPNCRIRIRPYIGRTWPAPITDDMCHFWVLPQHLYLYEDYVDVIDILADDIVREETLYKIYRSKKYELLLSALIEYFIADTPINALWIDDALAAHRVNCRQICQSTKPCRCHLCALESQILQHMPRMKYMLKHPELSPQSQS